jgi:hypothetical protein
MNKKTLGAHTSAATVTQLPLYKKALEICNLSFRLRTQYASKESSVCHTSTRLITNHHLDALILTAIGLPQTIAQAAVSKDIFAQHGLSNCIQTATKQVKHHLRMLRRHRPIKEVQCTALSAALKDFGRLQRQWSLLQIHKN